MERNDLNTKDIKIQDNKSLGIISYLTWVGLLVAFLMNRDKNDPYVKFHIRQNLGLFAVSIIGGLVRFIPGIGGILLYVVFLALFIFWIIGLIGAINGREAAVPVVGGMFQDWFKGV
ncbi:hypothetical protein CHU00_05640 [Sphingobacterium cellulitidis]|uniref:DUF4870 domain-containing protein n=1 Tax=Sphingobacterium cellulitidis TaxID=1768011 RepID=UPI000B9429D9|nr:DUF4870 domain-containing protein [Sphingobacterium cellulitidis]OYD46812.1 hypothetical protein CHU00_05640 [Sphingobacterium cellulitidis]